MKHASESLLLRYVVSDLDDIEAGRLRRHLRSCASCSESLAMTRRLDRALAAAGKDIVFGEDVSGRLKSRDPFARRPLPRARMAAPGWDRVAQALAAADAARGRSRELTAEAIATLDLTRLEDGYALAYALENARTWVGAPRRMVTFAKAAVKKIREAASHGENDSLLSPIELIASARLLEGAGWNGLRRADRAGVALRAAYKSFGRACGPERAFALVELEEAKRRLMSGSAREAAILAFRAERSFDLLKLDADAARAAFTRGEALAKRGKRADPFAAFESALDRFERLDQHPAIVATLERMADVAGGRGQLAECERRYRRIFRRIRAKDAPVARRLLRAGLLWVAKRHGRPRERAVTSPDLHSLRYVPAELVPSTMCLVDSMERGLADVEAGRIVSQEEAEARLSRWLEPAQT